METRKKVVAYQPRAIIGSGDDARHFILKDENEPNVWAIPGCFPELHGYHNLGIKTVTTAQLKGIAKKNKRPFKLVPDYFVIRTEVEHE